MTDFRLAEVLHRQGYHPTFLMNQPSPAMKSLDKLEALGVEVGSHCWHHPFLFILPPQRAMEECVEMRKLLEKQLKHPVISFAYPNGYTPAYDTQGDYVLRAVKAAGYWSGRTTDTAMNTYNSITDALTMRSNGFFGGRDSLIKDWEKTRPRRKAASFTSGAIAGRSARPMSSGRTSRISWPSLPVNRTPGMLRWVKCPSGSGLARTSRFPLPPRRRAK